MPVICGDFGGNLPFTGNLQEVSGLLYPTSTVCSHRRLREGNEIETVIRKFDEPACQPQLKYRLACKTREKREKRRLLISTSQVSRHIHDVWRLENENKL